MKHAGVTIRSVRSQFKRTYGPEVVTFTPALAAINDLGETLQLR